MAWNTGGLAMIGIFGSKNSFGLTQALLIQVGVWVLLDHGQRGLMRALALIGVVGGSVLIVAALSVGAVVPLFGALAFFLLAFQFRPFPPPFLSFFFFPPPPLPPYFSASLFLF